MSAKIINLPQINQIERTQKLSLINAEKLLETEEETEILREQIESLKQILRYQEQKLQETEQELMYTNQDLCAALTSEQLTLNEAKKLAKNLLATEKPVRDVIAELLSAIYSSPVKAQQLE